MLKPISILTFFLSVLSPFACCPAWRFDGYPVRIADQEVLIVWDSENQTEHFVRRANFQSEAAPKDFGFLVPTPTQPKLSEAPDLVFRELGEIIKPKTEVRKRTRLSLMPLLFAPFAAIMREADSKSAALSDGVQVLERAIVGGFEVAVIRASDTQGLIKWLEENEYNARPELRDWVNPYVEKQWILTAFKYAGNPDQPPHSLARASVCLSFKTDAPFFPYRVPSDVRVKPEDGSLLRIYFAGTERMVGEFENGEDRSWKARTRFSDRDKKVAGVIKKVIGTDSDADFPDVTWLTSFEDETWPGGAEDLYFKPSPEKEAVNPAPIVKAEVKVIRLPLDVILVGVGVAICLYCKTMKRRAASV